MTTPDPTIAQLQARQDEILADFADGCVGFEQGQALSEELAEIETALMKLTYGSAEDLAVDIIADARLCERFGVSL